MNDVVQAVSAWLVKERIPFGEELVVGCSGGGDSTALLVALRQLERSCHAVYVDHGLREGTDAEAAHVAALASAHSATFGSVKVGVDRAGNLLANARAARYRALSEVAIRRHARFVAVAHTATDQAETVAFRALRGDVVQALAGIPPRRWLTPSVELIRPMLEVTRAQAAQFVVHLSVIDDPTNHRIELTRTRMRKLLGQEESTAQELVKLATSTRQWVASVDRIAEALGPLEQLDATAVAAAGSEVALRLLRRAGLYRAGKRHAHALLALCTRRLGSRSIDLGDGWVAERSYGALRIGARRQDGYVPRAVEVMGWGRYRLGQHEIEIRDAVVRGLLRTPQPGDRMRTRVGHRKLQNLFTDRKIPRWERAVLPLLTVDDEVVWVAGIGLATNVSATVCWLTPLGRVQ